MERAEAGKYDVLLVARLDRLSRDYATLVILARRLQRRGVEVVSTEEENGDTAMAEFVRGQRAPVAQLERAMIRKRLSASKAANKRCKFRQLITFRCLRLRHGLTRSAPSISG